MTVPPPSARILFRVWRDDDEKLFHVINSDSQVMRYVGDGEIWSAGRTRRFIESATEMLHRSGFCQWALIHKTSEDLIGFCGLVDSGDVPEIGWRLSRDYWGQGLATEAATAVLSHARETLGLDRVMATVQTDNSASVRLIQKLGMTHDRTFLRDGREIAVYSR